MARDNESIPKVRISYGAVVLRKNRTRPDSNPRPYDRDIHDRRLRPLRHNWDWKYVQKKEVFGKVICFLFIYFI